MQIHLEYKCRTPCLRNLFLSDLLWPDPDPTKYGFRTHAVPFSEIY